MDKFNFSLKELGLDLFLRLNYTKNTMKYFNPKTLILGSCLAFALMASPVLAVGNTIIFDQAIRTGSHSIPLTGSFIQENDPSLLIPHTNDATDVTVFLTFPLMPTGSGTCDIRVRTHSGFQNYISELEEITFVDGVEKIIDLETASVPDTAELDEFYFWIGNCVGVTDMLAYTSAPTDPYVGPTSDYGTGEQPEDLTIKASYYVAPPSGTLDEGATGGVIGAFVDSLVLQFTTNLPAILIFTASILFLLFGIRWVKRSMR